MDNRYHKYNCPPLMNDGRFLTSYVRGRVFDQYIRSANNINSGDDYKNFLQSNGDTILNNLKAHHRQSNTCKIEGRCLPMSGPTQDNLTDYLKSNNDKSEWYYQVENINKMNNYNDENDDDLLFDEQVENKNYDTLNAQKADELARDVYNNMQVQHEQRNLDANVTPQNATNAGEATGDDKDCRFCAVKK
jgi:hypothetical protein